MIICENFFLSVRISFYPYQSIFICENLFLSIIISKNLALQQNSLRRNWMPEQLSGLLIHVTGTLPWLLRLVKVFTSSELYLTTFSCLLFLIVQTFSFLIHLPFLSTVRPPLFTYPSLCSTCVTYGTSCHAICHQPLPTQPCYCEWYRFERAFFTLRHFLPYTPSCCFQGFPGS